MTIAINIYIGIGVLFWTIANVIIIHHGGNDRYWIATIPIIVLWPLLFVLAIRQSNQDIREHERRGASTPRGDN